MTDYRTDEPATGGTDTSGGSARSGIRGVASDAAAKAKSGAADLSGQAGDRIRSYAVDGKERASGFLDELADMLEDAATQVDEKLGAQFGGYAHQASGAVSNLAGTLRDRDVDDLVADAREFVRKSPGIAIGAAAAIGFVLVRVVKSGFEEARSLGTDPDAERDVVFTPETSQDGRPL